MTPEPREQWKPILGYDGLYEVSSLGRVRALFESWNGRYKAGRILKPLIRLDGYIAVNLYYPGSKQKGSSHPIHRLVLNAFKGPRQEGQDARHLDGSRTNNSLENLQWGTRKENVKDSINHGTFCSGEKCNFSKLSEISVLTIRRMRDEGFPYVEIAKQFGISRPQASRIGRRKSWALLPERQTI